LVEIASAYDKKIASGDYETLVLQWNASGKPPRRSTKARGRPSRWLRVAP